MNQLKTVPQQPQTPERLTHELPGTFSIHLNGPFTDDDTETVI